MRLHANRRTPTSAPATGSSRASRTRAAAVESSYTSDCEDKRRDYAAAGIPEYWIIDPAADRVLEAGDYVTAAERRLGDVVQSRLFADFSVTISSLLPQ